MSGSRGWTRSGLACAGERSVAADGRRLVARTWRPRRARIIVEAPPAAEHSVVRTLEAFLKGDDAGRQRQRWLASPAAILVAAWLVAVLAMDTAGLFLLFTYVPALAGTIAVWMAVRRLGRTGSSEGSSARASVILWSGLLILPLLPTACGKGFYVASWAVWPGVTASFADRVLAGFDARPPYRPSEGVVSYRCVCDPSTTDYVMLTIQGGTVRRVVYLPD